MDMTTRQWLVTTIAGFLMLGVWLLSSTATPTFVIDQSVKGFIFTLGVGALGLGQFAAYRAVQTSDALAEAENECECGCPSCDDGNGCDDIVCPNC